MAEHLAELSIESLTINTILSRRRNTSTKQSDDESIESFSDSFTFIKKDSCAIKAKSVILDRTDRNGEILEIGDRVRVRVLTKGRIKVSHGTVFEFGKLVTIKDCGGVRIQRK